MSGTSRHNDRSGRSNPVARRQPVERRPLEDCDIRLALVRPRRVCVRRRSARPRSTTTSQAAESGRMDMILDAGFEQPAGENVLVQSRTLRTTDPAPLRSRTSWRDSRSWMPFRTFGRRSIRATRARSPRTGTRPSSSSRSAATPTRPSTRSSRCSTPSTSCRRLIPRSSSASSATRARSTRPGLRRRPRQAGLLSLPITLIILVLAFGALVAAGIRRSGPDRRLRDVRAHRAAHGHLPGGDAGTRPGAPDRPGRRRRLLDVLLEAGTRGAGRWRSEQAALEAAAATSGRSESSPA